MKATIYALFDPDTHQVRYVGQTYDAIAQRLRKHVNEARRGNKKPVYDWMRTLLPRLPFVGILQDGIESPRGIAATEAETKWLKRFHRTVLNRNLRRNNPAFWDDLV